MQSSIFPGGHPPSSFANDSVKKVAKCHVFNGGCLYSRRWASYSIFRVFAYKKEFLKLVQKLFFAKIRIWQLAIFPGGHPPSSFAASCLYDRVRDGNGWDPAAWSPEKLL